MAFQLMFIFFPFRQRWRCLFALGGVFALQKLRGSKISTDADF
jgi:hypothetical protein